jgi:large subunit ribosomal protein LP0
MQKVRVALRGKAIVVMGKNTLIRKILRDMIDGEKLTKLEALVPLVVGNMGFVFTNDSLPEIRKIILDNKASRTNRPVLAHSVADDVQLI